MEIQFSEGENQKAKTGIFLHHGLPQHIFFGICCCIVSVRGYFRAFKVYQTANPELKWPFPEIRVLFSETKLSKRIPDQAIGG